MPVEHRLNSLLKALETAAMAVGMLAVLAIMVVVSLDAILRYALHAPFSWSYDLISMYLMVIIAFLPVSQTYREGHHVSVTLFVSRASPRVKLAADLIITLLTLGLLASIAVFSFGSTWDSYVKGEIQYGVIHFPIWLSYLPIALGCAVLVLRLVHHTMMLLFHREDGFVKQEGAMVE